MKIKYCPFCSSHKLETFEDKGETACDECGGVFKNEVVSEPQEILLEETNNETID